jgi:hypothetical protein
MKRYKTKGKHIIVQRWSLYRISGYNKLRGLSPRENYTDRATAACRGRYCELLRIEDVATDPHGRILGFLDRSLYFFFQVAPQLYSWSRVDLVPDPLLLRKSGSAPGIELETFGSVSYYLQSGHCFAKLCMQQQHWVAFRTYASEEAGVDGRLLFSASWREGTFVGTENKI